MQGASLLSIAEAEGLGVYHYLPALPVLPFLRGADHGLQNEAPPRLIPVNVPALVPPPAPIGDTGQVVLDTTAMVYDRVFAYYDVIAKKQSSERRLFSRHDVARQPKATGARGLSGDKKVERLRHLLEHGFSDDRGRPIIRSKEQRELHETYIKVGIC